MLSFKCIKETFFDGRLYKPGNTYSGKSAPAEYFAPADSGGMPKPAKRMRADGKIISPDSPAVLPNATV